ncbi:MAG: cation diffusion facilitator family transporter [Thermoplasmatota archaeon]
MDGYRKGLILEYLTVGYNIVEAVLSILFGALAGSVALVGFGLDSIVESLSGGVLLWRLHQHKKVTEEQEERIEFIAVRLVAVTFIILGLYVLFESLVSLGVPKLLGAPESISILHREEPDVSLPGIAIAVASLIVMPVLAYLKKKTGKEIGSKALVADAKETLVCAWLSVALLGGLLLNALFGWWWADPVAGLFIVAFLFKEGFEQWGEAGEDDDD